MRWALLAAALAAGVWAQEKQVAIPVPDNVELVRAVPFARPGGIELVADLYLPKGPGPFPAALYIHGGGWASGDRTQLRRQAAYMAGKGVMGMAIEYRLAGQATYPAAFEDCEEALRWLRANAVKYRVDPGRIAAVGSSAGGHLASMLGVASEVKVVIAFNAVLDLSGVTQAGVARFLGHNCQDAPKICSEASPVKNVTAKSAPFLLLHGTADKTVPYAQAVEMQKRLKDAGMTAELFTAEGAGHTFWASKQWFDPSTKAMEEFLGKHL